ncbi:alpha/beta hydrolase family protein [Porphyromonas macacae]|uniref:alpha/beta hydrolase family protein n=1 Tax=Porphyromonas macacae TaxID=28115 RepID=UPI0021D331E9|nr:S9 family peptidase [Porphyromonas macacae]
MDTNVPTAESVNMYNALKTLGRTVEFIEFTGQDHFILEHDRKISWTNTMFAWFAKWLQDNPKWWDDLYPSISL